MKNKIIKTKQELHWHIISNYLDDISNFWVAHTDETFKKLLSEMQKYVNGKLRLNGNGDIIETYVTVVQSAVNNAASSVPCGTPSPKGKA